MVHEISRNFNQVSLQATACRYISILEHNWAWTKNFAAFIDFRYLFHIHTYTFKSGHFRLDKAIQSATHLQPIASIWAAIQRLALKLCKMLCCRQCLFLRTNRFPYRIRAWFFKGYIILSFCINIETCFHTPPLVLQGLRGHYILQMSLRHL